jgi:DnaJ-class molecular chaperone
MSDDWEYSEQDCPKCGSQMTTRTCNSCGGDGYVEDDEEDTDVGFGEESCSNCDGDGHETWCRECGWDDTFKSFMSPEYERAWQEKQGQVRE